MIEFSEEQKTNKLFKLKKLICNCWVINWSFFTIIGIYIFLLVQKILIPEWNWPVFQDNTGWAIECFEKLKKDSLDVVFVGTSHMLCGISPMEMYNEYGIVSYNLATTGQPLDMTFLLLEDMFKKQSPQYVVLDSSSLYLSQIGYGDSRRRYVLDSVPFSFEKLKAAIEYSELATDLSDKDKMERFNSVLFPIIYYHTNWKTVLEGNFDFESDINYCTAGYVISPIKSATYTDQNGVNQMIKEMKKDNVKHNAVKNADGDIDVIEKSSILYNPKIIDAQRKNINRINELCKKNNAKLVLAKLPVIEHPHVYETAWSKEKYTQTKALSVELGIDYFDLNYDADVDLDLANDFIDSGAHLNYLGAEKASKCMGNYLSVEYGLGGKRSSYMDEKIENYEKITNIARLNLESNFLNYCDLLQENSNDYLICIASKEYWKNALLEEDYTALNNLGLYEGIQSYASFGNSYIALIDGGTIEHEEISNRIINYKYKYDDNDTIKLVSAGAMAGNSAEIYLNETQISMNGRGLNIVVIDKATNKVIDSCYIDTNIEGGHSLVHDGNGYNYMFDCVYGEN